jgi:hypothetical protein
MILEPGLSAIVDVQRVDPDMAADAHDQELVDLVLECRGDEAGAQRVAGEVVDIDAERLQRALDYAGDRAIAQRLTSNIAVAIDLAKQWTAGDGARGQPDKRSAGFDRCSSALVRRSTVAGFTRRGLLGRARRMPRVTALTPSLEVGGSCPAALCA